MPWVRLNDTHHDDPRIMAVPLNAVGLLHLGLIWSNAQLMDGWVSDAFLRSRANRATKRLTSVLAERRLLCACERDGVPGWRIAADLVAFQPTRADVERSRAEWRERQRKHRTSRRDNAVTEADVTPLSSRDTAVTEALVTPVSLRPVPSRPDPFPEEQEQRAERAALSDTSTPTATTEADATKAANRMSPTVDALKAQVAAARRKTSPTPDDTPNLKVLTKLAHDVLDRALDPNDDQENRDEMKDRSARAKLAYDGRSIVKALDSAMAQRARRDQGGGWTRAGQVVKPR